MSSDEMTKKKCSNDSVDAIAALVLIATFVGGMIYWLSGMPS